MNPANTRTFWVEPVVPRAGLRPGTMMRVELDSQVGDYGLGPHVVGQAEMFEGGKLKLSITTVSAAGREAIALVADDILDVTIHGSKPVVMLTQV